MQGDPCVVCKGTELKLIDGFYYCTECNTQNSNVRETVVEQKALGDGTFGLVARRKIVKLQDSKIEMSREWIRWHTYNFIILGLADELVAAGAKPSFKLKLLWIWTRYIKKYQNKDELGIAKKSQAGNNDNVTLTSFMVEENSTSSPAPDKDDELEIEKRNKKKRNVIMDDSERDIKFLSKGVIIAMLYLALNLDESDIQLYHLYRFIKEKRLNFSNLLRFLPEDIDVKSLRDEWISFQISSVCNMHRARAFVISLLRKLDLGTPKVPDLRKLVDNFLIELCLPSDIKPMIYSLMYFHNCHFLDMDNKTKENLVQIPDYEGVVMSYILVALKMCFGLDGHYEEKLSDAVERINDKRNLSKSYRVGKYSEPSTRLFSFREWCSYMQFRKIMLCKSYLHMAEQHYLDIDDYVYLEHMDDRPQNIKNLQDETAMDLIKKIPYEHEGRVIPKNRFLPSLTPMFDYTEIIIEHNQDPEIKALLSEDFTQYSLNYACEYLELVDSNTNNIIKGVSEDRKTVNKVIRGTIVMKNSNSEMVYVKNCENRHWMITNPPTMEHVICEDEQNVSNDKESDHGYDSENPANDREVSKETQNIDDTDQSMKEVNTEVNNSENPANDREVSKETQNIDDTDQSMKEVNTEVNNSENPANDREVSKETQNIDDTDQSMKEVNTEVNNSENPANEIERSQETGNIKDITDQGTKETNREIIITEEDSDKNIFDDLFEELDLKDEMEQNNEDLDFINEDQPLQNNNDLYDDRLSDASDDSYIAPFNPDTFDREQTIKELILNACKKYKIAIPREYKVPTERRKRKANVLSDVERQREPRKKSKRSQFDSKKKVDELLGDYYSYMQSDVLSKMQEEVSIAIRKSQLDSVLNVNQNETANTTNVEQVSDAISERSSVITGNVENQNNVTPQNQSNDNPPISVLEQTNKEQNLDETDNIDEIDENFESKLFEGEEEMELDDLIPKGDPKFDKEKYDINQLHIKIKPVEIKEELYDIHDNPKLEEILKTKIEQCKNSTEFEKLRAVRNWCKTKYESDSDDDVPLNVIQEEKKTIEKMISWEDNFDPLINKENLSEFKYWFRHYDRKFMTQSLDWHRKFDEELKQNIPSSFYFVINECASILNCSVFTLYKHMAHLEKYISARAKYPD